MNISPIIYITTAYRNFLTGAVVHIEMDYKYYPPERTFLETYQLLMEIGYET